MMWPPEYRSLLMSAQDGCCPICGDALLSGGFLSIDHVLPKSAGGADMIGNLLLVHGRCNLMKADRMPTGCECVWLMAVNNRIGMGPQRW